MDTSGNKLLPGHVVLPLLNIVAIVLLASGDIYHQEKGEVRSFGIANRIVAGIIGLLWIGGLINAIARG